MLTDFGNVLVFATVGVLFIWVSLVAGTLVRAKAPNADKAIPYECGERPVGSGWFQFNMRFYIVALIFVIFELEIVFMVPVMVVFRDFIHAGAGMLALAEILVFVGILLVGLAYVWTKGDIEWVKPSPRIPDVPSGRLPEA